MNVSTRMIAAASGVAEGTIFRVFPDKESLIRATIDAALDPGPVLEELDAIRPDDALRPTLLRVVTVLQRRITKIFRLFNVMEIAKPPATNPTRDDVNALIGAKLKELLGPFKSELRYSLEESARFVRILIFAGSHPAMTDGKVLRPREIVALLLDGIGRSEDGTA